MEIYCSYSVLTAWWWCDPSRASVVILTFLPPSCPCLVLPASPLQYEAWVNQFCHHSPAFYHPKGKGWALSSSQTSDNKEVRKNRSWLVPPLCLNDKVTYTCLVFIAISSRGGHPRCQIHNTVVYWRLCTGLDYNWRICKACGAVWPKSEQNCPSHN